MKFFLSIILLSLKATSFSQINHMDSINYSYDLKMNRLMGNDIKGKTMPEFVARSVNGELFTKNNLRSKKITFINFWFESCAPCIAEFEALEKFFIKNKDRENFQFISITFEPDSTIEKIRKKYNFTYPIYYLPDNICKKVKFKAGYPTNLIADKHLRITYSIAGGSMDPDAEDKKLNYFIQDELDKQLQ